MRWRRLAGLRPSSSTARAEGGQLAAHRLPGGVEHLQARWVRTASAGAIGGGRGVGGLQQGVADALAQVC